MRGNPPSFNQNTVEFYGNHILLTMICIFWAERRLKARYFALLLTETGKVVLKHHPPPLDTRSPFHLGDNTFVIE